RGWAMWPRGWQYAGGVVAAAVLIGLWRLAAFAQPLIAQIVSIDGFERAASFSRSADEAATGVRVVWGRFLPPVATSLSILAIPFALACALLWTAVERLAPGGASQR